MAFNILTCRLFAHVRQQSHESCSLDGFGHGVLARRCTTGLPAAHNSTVSVDQFLKQIDVLVIHVHRTWTDAINEEWILLFCSLFGIFPLTRSRFHHC